MLEDTPTGSNQNDQPDQGAAQGDQAPAKKAAARKSATKKATTTVTTRRRSTAKKASAPEAAPATDAGEAGEAEAPAAKTPAKKSAAKKTAAKKAPAKTAAKKTAAKKAAATKTESAPPTDDTASSAAEQSEPQQPAPPTVTKTTRKRTTAKAAAPEAGAAGTSAPGEAAGGATAPLFQAPDTAAAPARKPRKKAAAAPESDERVSDQDAEPATAQAAKKSTKKATEKSAEKSTEKADASGEKSADTDTDTDTSGEESGGEEGAGRRRRRRGGRRRRKSGGENGGDNGGDQTEGETETDDSSSGKQAQRDPQEGKDDQGESGSTSRRRRRRRRAGDDGAGGSDDDPQNTVTKVRQGRSAEDQITAVTGSTRLEAKKQRRREGREAGRRRAPIVSEAEFLARRESVERVMAIRQREDLTQIAVLEDKVLVEHYVARESQTSLIGNVYLGRVQNVLPSMEAAFIDIGKGRNAVLYAGEVNWSALGHKEGAPRKIESVLSSGQTVLVQVTKDPVGHKGARLTSQISLAGRFLVYVPDGTNSGISRKLPDTERSRLKALLKEIVPDSAGVIVRTAAEGASEDELTRDVERLKARWEDIEQGAKKSAQGPKLLYGEPDLTLKVVRDLFTEDFAKLVVQGEEAWETVRGYVDHVAPDLVDRLDHYGSKDGESDLFAAYRIDEQIHKGLDRKVWLPSGGSLIIDRTEAMTVVDVNTGKFTGSGGNLEETVTKNNLEAAEEMVRQLRLRDIGGIIVIDFIDMVLESNRDLVLRRLVECLGRDRTRHQVAEVTSLGLVQMTRKRIGTGLLEAFSEPCEHCGGRGLLVADAPVEPKKDQESKRGSRRSRGGRGKGDDFNDKNGDQKGDQNGGQKSDKSSAAPSPKDVAAMARAAKADEPSADGGQDRPERPAAAADTSPSEPSATAPEQPTEQPTEQSTEPEKQPTEQPIEPEKQPATPTVTTRTRRRSASRPAGPPAGTPESESGVPAMPQATPQGGVGAPADHGIVEPGTADEGQSGVPVVEHVPVKKRGSRKR